MSTSRSISCGFASNSEKSCTPAGKPARNPSKASSAAFGSTDFDSFDRISGRSRLNISTARVERSAG